MHLHQLIDGGLIRVRTQGRHPYHELADPRSAAVVEALAQLATTSSPPGEVLLATLSIDPAALRVSRRIFARCCIE